MKINIDISKPSFTTYAYAGNVNIDGEEEFFYIEDCNNELEIVWDNPNKNFSEEIENTIIEVYKSLWLQ